jgi:hypothetical protein
VRGPSHYTQRADPNRRDIPYAIPGLLDPDRYDTQFTEALVSRGPIKRISQKVYRQRTNGEAYASGVAVAEALARAAVFKEDLARPLQQDLEQFVEMVQSLPEFDSNFRVLSLERAHFPERPNQAKLPRRWLWSFLDGALRCVRRRAIVARVWEANRSRLFILIEIERRPLCYCKDGHPEFYHTLILVTPARTSSQKDQENILNFLVRKRGTLPRESVLMDPLIGWRIHGFSHGGARGAERSRRLIKKLEKL